MEESIFQHVRNRIEKAEIITSPYPHFYIDQVFPEDYYEEVLKNIPERGFFDPSLVADSERFTLPLTGGEIERLPFMQCLFWTHFANGMLGKPLRDLLLKKFQGSIRERFQDQFNMLKFGTVAELFQDKTNYSIGPHTDHPDKVVTLLFYLPKNREDAPLGTSVYVPHDPSFECKDGRHHPFEPFQKVYTAPFMPNSAFCFVRSDRSFHGVEPIIQEKVERNLLNYFIRWSHVSVC